MIPHIFSDTKSHKKEDVYACLPSHIILLHKTNLNNQTRPQRQPTSEHTAAYPPPGKHPGRAPRRPEIPHHSFSSALSSISVVCTICLVLIKLMRFFIILFSITIVLFDLRSHYTFPDISLALLQYSFFKSSNSFNLTSLIIVLLFTVNHSIIIYCDQNSNKNLYIESYSSLHIIPKVIQFHQISIYYYQQSKPFLPSKIRISCHVFYQSSEEIDREIYGPSNERYCLIHSYSS